MPLFCAGMKGFMCQNSGRTTLRIAASLLVFAGLIQGDQASQGSEGRLKGLSLEQLGNIEVTTASKQPVKVRADSSGNLRDHSRGYSAVRRYQYPGGAAFGAGRGSGAN